MSTDEHDAEGCLLLPRALLPELLALPAEALKAIEGLCLSL